MRVALDGPVASGKTVVGRRLAERLAYRYLDTGAMYRAITWLALRDGANLDDADALGKLAGAAELRIERPVQHDGRDYTVLLDGRDITWDIRSPDVEQNVSRVSAHPPVRRELVFHQRRIAASGDIVMVGRDIGTVVLPDAELKIFLTAAPVERARRRAAQMRASGRPADDAAVLADLIERDRIDSSRADSPLKPAPDACLVDTTGRTVDDVVAELLRRVKDRV